MPVTQETLDEIALSRAEYEAIVDRLGREPQPLELGLFGALWSEHCGYKHTKPLLRLLPGKSDRLLVAPGAENAGVVDIGDGLAVAMKIESHNHPSAVEPHEGAATGVGGIVRDIFAMGARPIALMNSLRFGPPSEPHNRFLLHGVVGGISAYGNCIGIPNVGGEVVFDPSYSGNPLVNAMCVGLIEDGRVVSATARAPGDLLFLVGADTGRDGIHGASGLASRVFVEEAEMRSAVQVGNPFLEKVLIEACLEAIKLPGVVGMQDLGAAGLTSAAIEMAERSGMGLRMDILKVPRREEGMTPYEVMLSESQERMLLAVTPGHEDAVRRLFEKWDLDATVIGEFETGGSVRIFDGDAQVTETPIAVLTEAPEYPFNPPKPDWLSRLQDADLSQIPVPTRSPATIFLELLASPNIASKLSVFRQYDHQVQNNTVVPPGGDAAVLRLKGTKRAIAMSTDCNGRICYLDPFIGSAISVAEACRNLACVGAEPLALTDGLNFGNPEKPDVQYQLTESINGIKAAAEMFGIPVVSGNASLYNESRGRAIYPTPIIGALGLLDDATRHATIAFKNEGDALVLLGAESPWDDVAGLAGSELLALTHGRVEGQPALDLELERSVQAVCRSAIRSGLVSSAHDCSDGGLAVAVAESAIAGGIGAVVHGPEPERWDAALFGERQSRIILSLPKENLVEVERLASERSVPFAEMGSVGGNRLQFGDMLDVPLEQAADAWHNGFDRATSI
ncbi:MAG: phosphoribosylformylglycinamidine synthase subunit PurL [Dehalococcoidia bacterium]